MSLGGHVTRQQEDLHFWCHLAPQVRQWSSFLQRSSPPPTARQYLDTNIRNVVPCVSFNDGLGISQTSKWMTDACVSDGDWLFVSDSCAALLFSAT